MLTGEPCWVCGGNGGSFTPRGCTDWCAEMRAVIVGLNAQLDDAHAVARWGDPAHRRLVP